MMQDVAVKLLYLKGKVFLLVYDLIYLLWVFCQRKALCQLMVSGRMQGGHHPGFLQYVQYSTDVIVDMKGNDKTTDALPCLAGHFMHLPQTQQSFLCVMQKEKKYCMFSF